MFCRPKVEIIPVEKVHIAKSSIAFSPRCSVKSKIRRETLHIKNHHYKNYAASISPVEMVDANNKTFSYAQQKCKASDITKRSKHKLAWVSINCPRLFHLVDDPILRPASRCRFRTLIASSERFSRFFYFKFKANCVAYNLNLAYFCDAHRIANLESESHRLNSFSQFYIFKPNANCVA